MMMVQRSYHRGLLLSTSPAFVLQLVVLVLFLALANSEEKVVNDDPASSLPAATSHTCYQVVDWLRDNTQLSLASSLQQPPLLTIHVHRNGEATSCGTAAGITGLDLIQAILRRGENCAAFDAYVLESVLTDAIYRRLTTTTPTQPADAAKSVDACSSIADGEDVAPGLAGYCDMGVARTVGQPDFDHLVRLPGTETLPCRWRTRAGVRITTLAQLLLPESATSTTASLTTTTTTLDLYGVPAGRQFHFSPSHVGDVIDLPHLCPSCRLSVISVTPAIFELHDFLTDDDAAELLGPSAYFEGRSVIAFNEANPNAKNYRTSETGYLTNAAYQAALQQ
jgi:hypothetical protein